MSFGAHVAPNSLQQAQASWAGTKRLALGNEEWESQPVKKKDLLVIIVYNKAHCYSLTHPLALEFEVF